ncbi:hypothetical protein M0R36_04360 [bacterium]|nr:hypothetical protein [bacterium]
MFNALMIHILKRLEAFPDATFRGSELVGISKRLFDQMVKDTMIEFSHRDKDGDSYISDRLGDSGIQRNLRIRGRKITAFSGDPEVDTIVLEEEEILYYRFNTNKLISQIRSQNKLEETVDSLSERLFFIGSLQMADERASLYLALFENSHDYADSLKALTISGGRYDRYVVISPFAKVSCQKTRNILNGIKISQFTFEEAFEKEYVLRSGLVFSETKATLPKTLYLTGKIEKEKHIVSVDKKEGGLTEANFKLLLELVVALKTTEDGWIYTGEGDWQSIDRLKGDFQRVYPGYEFKKFIINGRKKYRLVLPADAVTYDRAMLKKIKDGTSIPDLVNKLPIIRKRR